MVKRLATIVLSVMAVYFCIPRLPTMLAVHSLLFHRVQTISPQLVAEDSTALLVAKHQWKLAAKPFILKPIELTKYIAGGEAQPR